MKQREMHAWIKQFRAKHYGLFRKIVDHKMIQQVLVKTVGQLNRKVRTPEGYYAYVNPFYHSQFYSEGSILEYEPHIRKFFEGVLRDGMVVYDIGANVGIFSLLFAKKVGSGGQVYAFEPEVINCSRLQLSKAHNHLTQLRIEFCCVDEHTGNQLFDRRGGAFSGRIVDAGAMDTRHHISVKRSVSIDDYVISQNNAPPDVVKIDVEGHEYKVLRGMMKTLRENRPVIMLELHQQLCDSIPDIHELFASSGYACGDLYEFVQSGFRPLSLDEFRRAFHIIAKSDK
ncbi:MAG: FkbM family methyltransferase [Thermodesulfobacteriota bacterium]